MGTQDQSSRRSTERLEEAIAYVRELVIPAAPMTPGFAGMISLIDRESGRSIGIPLGRRCKRCSERGGCGRGPQAGNSIRRGNLGRRGRYGVADSFLTPNET